MRLLAILVIAHRLAEAGWNQSYTAAGHIIVNPGEDVIKTDGRNVSSGTFNVFINDMSFGTTSANSNSRSAECSVPVKLYQKGARNL